MKIALLTTSYPAHPDDAAGHFVREEALALCAGGHEVHVVAPSTSHGSDSHDGPLQTWPIAHAGAFGWPGALERLRSRPWRGAGAAAFAWLASRRLRHIRPDKIIAHWIVPSAVPIAVAANRGALLEVVAHGSDVRLLLAAGCAVRMRIVEALLARASRIRFASEILLGALHDALPGPTRDRLSALAVVDPPRVRIPPEVGPGSKRLRVASPALRVVALGRLIREKRIDLVVQSANRLPHARYSIVGDGPERARLQSLARLDNVRFLGALGRLEALRCLAASDVLVHPSAREGAPSAVREARLLDVPVVACCAGDTVRWAARDPGIVLVEPTAPAIAYALTRLDRSRDRC